MNSQDILARRLLETGREFAQLQHHRFKAVVVEAETEDCLPLSVRIDQPEQTPLAAAILIALRAATAPVRGKELAKMAGRKADAGFRRAVSALVKSGAIRKAKGGYEIVQM